MSAPSVISDPTYLLLIVGILFVHACYQLSVSVLAYFSSHSLSHRVSANHLLGLGLSYSLGAIITTSLILTATATIVNHFNANNSHLLIALIAGLTPLIGLITIIWYYRKGRGTRLWLPRPFANYLTTRARKTKSIVEAAFLGSATVVGELPFLAGPLLLITILIAQTTPSTWLAWSGLYSFLAYLPLFAVTMYITSGHSVARVQRWREKNKSFLQWTSGSALILLTIYLTVLQLGVSA